MVFQVIRYPPFAEEAVDLAARNRAFFAKIQAGVLVKAK